MIPGVENPQSWNRYAYTINNPLKYNDPSGHILNIVGGALLGGIAGAAVLGLKEVMTPGLDLSRDDYVAAIAVGAAAGALVGSGVGATAGIGLIASSMGTGIATSATAYAISSGKDYNSSEMVFSAVVGGLAGAATGGVSNAFAKPLPLNYGGCLNEGLREFAHMGANILINGGAAAMQSSCVS